MNKLTPAERRQAENEVRDAAERIITANPDASPAYLAAAIHQAYIGRQWDPPNPGPAYCPNHEHTRMPCGLCPPGV
jgi:hypothetical protein